MTKKLCAIPWKEVYLAPGGDYSLCCKEDQTLTTKFTATITTLHDHWNGQYLDNVRQRFISGDAMPECQQCWSDEDSGKLSYRQRRNLRYFNQQELDQDQLIKIDNPAGIMISTGNQCQLRCVSCNPVYSRSIIKDYKKLNWSMNFKSRAAADVFSQELSTEVIDQIKQITPTLSYLHLTGGEPTLNRPLWEYVDWVIQNNYAKNIDILLVTNGVNVRPHIIAMLTKFRRVWINISTDGVGALEEYVRWPTNWSKKLDFIKTSQQTFPDTSLHTVAHALNICGIPDLVRWSRSQGIKHSIECLHYPNELSVEHLPDMLKQELVCQLTELKSKTDSDDYWNSQYLDQCLDSIIYRLQMPRNSNQWDTCVKIIHDYNTIRPMALENITPLLTPYVLQPSTT